LSGPVLRTSNLQFFLARVAQAREEAEAAWSALAQKAERSERLRVQEEKRKADLRPHGATDD